MAENGRPKTPAAARRAVPKAGDRPSPWLDRQTETCQSEVLPLSSVVLKHPRDAFGSAKRIARQWRRLGYSSAPDLRRATREYEEFVRLLEGTGATVRFLPDDGDETLDSLYPRDASIATDRGMILCRMGKAERRGEPAAHGAFFAAAGIPVCGRIEAPGTLEGGDVAWLDRHTLAVARTYRSNDEGLRQLASLLADRVDILRMDAPHWRGPGDVFHLMSVLSPVDERTLLVYSPLVPIPLREALLERGFELVEVPDEELGTLGCNALALAPGAVILPRGNPRTRARLEGAGVEVREISACEICVKGAGGPTCLSRPLARSRPS